MAKQRSPNYPAISLRDAVEGVRAIYDKEKKTLVSSEVIAKSLGYTSLSGIARTKIAALKKYSLLDGDERKGMRVSDLAVRIMYPKGADDQISSLQEAALTPELFKMLYTDYRNGSDEAIRHHLINRLDFAPQGAKQLIAAFRDTYTYAGLNLKEYTDSETSDKSEAGDMQTQHEQAPTTQADFRTNRFDVAAVFASTDAFIWPLSKPRGVKAELRITGDYTRADLDRLKKQIDILVESLDDNEAAE